MKSMETSVTFRSADYNKFLSFLHLQAAQPRRQHSREISCEIFLFTLKPGNWSPITKLTKGMFKEEQPSEGTSSKTGTELKTGS
jgi:hypothetical protein